MELEYLISQGLLQARHTTGMSMTLPRPTQIAIATHLIQYFSKDFGTAIKTSLRSREDFRYLIESVGPVFSFSAAQHGTLIQQALDLYELLLSPAMFELCPEAFSIDTRAIFYGDMLRQLSLLFAAREDAPQAEAQHVALLGSVLNLYSTFATLHESTLDVPTWRLFLVLLFGAINYYSVTPLAPRGATHSLASVAFEVLLRSKTLDAPMWALLSRLTTPVMPFVAAEWAVAVVALSRVLTTVLVGGPLSQTVTLRWFGMLPAVRKESKLLQYSSQQLAASWKRFLTLFELGDVVETQSLDLIVTGLRDMIVILSRSAFYLTPSTVPDAAVTGAITLADPFNYTVSQVPSARFSVPCPSTESLSKLCGMTLAQVAIRRTTDISDRYLVVARIRAIEGLCALHIRRESTSHCADGNPTPLMATFLAALTLLADDENPEIRSSVLHHSTALHQLDLTLPHSFLDAFIRCSTTVLRDAPKDKDDEEEDYDDVSDTKALLLQGGTDEEITARRAAALHLCNIAQIVVAENHTQLITPALLGLLTAVENCSRDPVVFQRVISACILLQPMFGSEKVPEVMAEIRGNAAAILRAPYGLYPHSALDMCTLFLSQAPDTQARPMAQVLCTFCVNLRKIEATQAMQQQSAQDSASASIPIQDLSKLCFNSCRHLATLLTRFPSLLLEDEGTLRAVTKLFDGMTKQLTIEGTAPLRRASMLVYQAIQLREHWPFADGAWSCTSTVCESGFSNIRAIKLFTVNGYRLLTMLTVGPVGTDTKAPPAIILIARDPFGKRAWRWTLEDLRRGERNVPYMAPDQLGVDPQPPSGSGEPDSLSVSQLEQRLALLIQGWSNDEAVREGLLTQETASSHPTSAAFSAASAESKAQLISPHDDFDEPLKPLRLLALSLGLHSSRTRELPIDRMTISLLKGIDRIPTADQFSVSIILLQDSDDINAPLPHAFARFLDCISWQFEGQDGDGLTQRVCGNANCEISYTLKRLTPGDFEQQELERESKPKGKSANSLEPEYGIRIVWDESTPRYLANSVPSPQLDLFTELTPQWRRPLQSQALDFILNPLPNRGMYLARVSVPSSAAANPLLPEEPARWGAPLHHGALLTAEVLGSSLRLAVEDACYTRRIEVGRYNPPSFARRSAIKALIQSKLDTDQLGWEPLPTQATVSFFLDSYTPHHSVQPVLVGAGTGSVFVK